MREDILGQPIDIGDIVAYTHSETTQMFLARIIGFTPKMVRTMPLNRSPYVDSKGMLKDECRLLKITDQYKSFAEMFPEKII